MKSRREVKHGRVPPPDTNNHTSLQHRPWATCTRSVMCPTRHPPFRPVVFIRILHDPCLLGSCVPPGSSGEALFDEAEGLTSFSNPLAIASHQALSTVHLLSTSLPGLCSYQHIGVRINSGALERYHLPQAVIVLRSRDDSIKCIALLSPFIFGGLPVAQMPPQLSTWRPNF